MSRLIKCEKIVSFSKAAEVLFFSPASGGGGRRFALGGFLFSLGFLDFLGENLLERVTRRCEIKKTQTEQLVHPFDKGELGLEYVTALVACNRVGRPNPDRVIVSRDVRGTPPLGNCYGLIADEHDEETVPVPSSVKTE